MEVQTKQVLDTLSTFKLKNADKYKFTTIGLFGSVARGESNEGSDVDIAVEFTYATLFTLARMKEELENILHRKVDLISLKASMLPGFREEIMKDIIYV